MTVWSCNAIHGRFIPRDIKGTSPFIFGDVTGNIYSLTRIPQNLMKLCSLEATLTSTIELRYSSLLLTLIKDKICGIEDDSSKIHFYSKELKSLQTVGFICTGYIHSLAQIEDEILIAALNGLYITNQASDKP